MALLFSILRSFPGSFSSQNQENKDLVANQPCEPPRQLRDCTWIWKETDLLLRTEVVSLERWIDLNA